ncbi:lysosomal acid phosphatase [Tetranychus urticae]|uniref:2-phosphoxylose phosphatase 1 n=1 Tax=Tetranychus urticae TaxID=32264 RepID=T1L2A0_TETUR|nr:lysosomal acid phosphatase [Tetranychus urticae]
MEIIKRQLINLPHWFIFHNICFLLSLVNNVAMDSTNNSPAKSSTLNQVIVLHKHGELSHSSIFPNIGSFENSNEPEGHLTSNGRQKMYQLGEALRSRYNSFLSNNPLEFKAESSDVDVALESGLLVLHGLAKAEGQWIYDNSTNYLPIPIHSSPQEYPCALDSDCDCPFIEQWNKSIDNHPAMKNIKANYKETIKYLVEKTNSTAFQSLTNLTILFKYLEYAKNHGYPLPDYYTREIYLNLSKIDQQFEQLEACSSDILSIRITGFFKQLKAIISENLSDVNETFKINKPKLHLFSSAELLLSSVLCGLGVSESKIIPEGATLVIELHEILGEDFVRLVYWNTDYTIEPTHLVPIYCNKTSDFCGIKEFLSNLDEFILPDWQEKCGLCPNGYRANEIMAIILCVIILTIIITTCAAVVRRRKHREEYDLLE